MGLTFYNKDDREESRRGQEFRTGVMGNQWYKEFEFQTVALQSKLDETIILVLGKDNTNDIKFVCAFHVFNSLNLRITVVPCLYFDNLDDFKAIDGIINIHLC